MRKIATLITVAMLSMGLTAVPAGGTENCVSKSEFSRIHKNMAKVKVHRVFDTKGKVAWRFTERGLEDMGRTYRYCNSPKSHFVFVRFGQERTPYWSVKDFKILPK